MSEENEAEVAQRLREQADALAEQQRREEQSGPQTSSESAEQNTQARPSRLLTDEAEVIQTGPRVYDFSTLVFNVEINVSRDPKLEKLVAHRINRPGLELYRRRDAMTDYQIITHPSGDSEEKIYDADANRMMWDESTFEVKGYKVGRDDPHPLDQWRVVDDRLRQLIPGSHKSMAIHTMFISNSKVRDDGDAGFVLGGDIPYIVDQEIGPGALAPWKVAYTFRELEESERLKYEDKSSASRNVGGARLQTARVIININAAIEAFNLVVLDIENGTVLSHTFKEWEASSLDQGILWHKEANREVPEAWLEERFNPDNYSGRKFFLAQISPVLKRQAVNAAVVAMRARARE